MKTQTDTLEDRIAAAVEARLKPILDRIQAAAETQPPAPEPKAPGDDEAFLDLKDAARVASCHRTTLLRLEAGGVLPPRRKMGARTGWVASEFREALRNLPENKRKRLAPAKH